MAKDMVRLTAEERTPLTELISTGRRAASVLTRARLRLKADAREGGPDWSDREMAEAVETSLSSVHRVRQAFVADGLAAALERPRPTGRQYRQFGRRAGGSADRLDVPHAPGGTCPLDAPVAGRPARGTGGRGHDGPGVRADHANKNDLKPWQQKPWVIPPTANAACVWAMADVLEVYPRPYDPQRPVVCLEEASQPLVADTRIPMPAAPGKLARIDDAYARQGTAHLCMVFAPVAGPRQVTVMDRRTAIAWAPVIQDVGEVYDPQADTLVLVMDHRNTHTPAAWSEACEPAEARRRLARLEMHHTPQHGSWFNLAETALSVLVTQGLDRRLPDQEPLTRAVAAWERQRHTAACRIDWQFTTQDARIKLKRLYPSIELG